MHTSLQLHLYPKALAHSVPVYLESDRRTASIRLTKMRRDATLSHSYAVRNPSNGAVVVQSKAILKHLYIGLLGFYRNSKQPFSG